MRVPSETWGTATSYIARPWRPHSARGTGDSVWGERERGARVQVEHITHQICFAAKGSRTVRGMETEVKHVLIRNSFSAFHDPSFPLCDFTSTP